MRGVVFDIRRFCLHDGPGIRTAVMLKGCNLRCRWCHTPESFSPLPQLGFDEEQCTHCGVCVAVCPTGAHVLKREGHTFQRELCTGCFACVSACKMDALETFGRWMESEDVLDEILRDREYYESSDGGVTFGGGEPTLQTEFTGELAAACKKEGLHTCLETNGLFDFEKTRPLLNNIDLVLLDIKLLDENEHRYHTGDGNAIILQNLARLAGLHKPMWLRSPVLPGVNDTNEHRAGLLTLKDVHPSVEWTELLYYHSFGEKKWKKLGLPYSYTG